MGKSLQGKELGKGITQRKDGRYQARFVNRFGKRQTIYANKLSEITKRLRDEQYEDKKLLNVINPSLTLNEWYDTWINVCKKHCRNTTIRTYNIQYNRLRDSIGWRKITSLNLVTLQKAFNELKNDKSRKDCKAVLVDMLNRAVEADMLVKNVAKGINPYIDNEEPEERHVLSDEEIKILLEKTKGTQFHAFLVVALGTGMRIGEILGLTFDCIDFDKGLITVNKTLCYLPNNGEAIYELHSPKTRAGKRQIPMIQDVKDVLLEQRKRKDKISKRHEPREGLEDLVFCSKTNNPVNEMNIRKAITYHINKIQTIDIQPFTPHELRHTFATKAIAKGMRPKTLQRILGHNSLKMTMDLYCHVENNTLIEEMALLEKMV